MLSPGWKNTVINNFFTKIRYFGTGFAKCYVTVSLVVNNRVMVQKRDIGFFDVPFLIVPK